MEFTDEEVYGLALEGNEYAKDILYDKYQNIIKNVLKKYYTTIKNLNIDMSEIEQEAYYAFCNALINFRDDKNTKLSTFISLCVNRKIRKIIKQHSGCKARFINNTYSLDYDYNDNITLIELVGSTKLDPLNNLTNKENYMELIKSIKERLSDQEFTIFTLMINGNDNKKIKELTNFNDKQIDNTMQRLKTKIREIKNNLLEDIF